MVSKSVSSKVPLPTVAPLILPVAIRVPLLFHQRRIGVEANRGDGDGHFGSPWMLR